MPRRSFAQHLRVVDLAKFDVAAGQRRPEPRDAAFAAHLLGRAPEEDAGNCASVGVAVRREP